MGVKLPNGTTDYRVTRVQSPQSHHMFSCLFESTVHTRLETLDAGSRLSAVCRSSRGNRVARETLLWTKDSIFFIHVPPRVARGHNVICRAVRRARRADRRKKRGSSSLQKEKRRGKGRTIKQNKTQSRLPTENSALLYPHAVLAASV